MTKHQAKWRNTYPIVQQRVRPSKLMVATPIGRDCRVSITIIGRDHLFEDDFDVVIEHLRWYKSTLPATEAQQAADAR